MFRKTLIDTDTDEDELFRQIQDGNKLAFTIVYKKYHKMLYVLAYQYLKDNDKAEDAVQNSFTKLWEFHSNISVSVSLKNYLYTMTKNYILNQIRKENNALINNYKIAQENNDYDDSLITTIEKKEMMNIFKNAIESLPEQKKLVCLYKIEHKFSNQEIAAKMDISINTVKTHYTQSIKILRTVIEKMLIFVIVVILF